MGKRNTKHNKNNKFQNGTKKVKTDWKCQTIPNDNPFFKQYYQKQLNIEQDDFQNFWAAMK